MPRPNQPWPIRLTHWANVPLLVIMAGNGLQILAAYPSSTLPDTNRDLWLLPADSAINS
jgi:hypothetical protein